MTTYTWLGNRGTNDPNDVTQAINWSPAGVPDGSGDIAVIGTGATLDALSAGVSTGVTFEVAGADTLNFVDQNFIQASITLGAGTTLNLTGTGSQTAGFDINSNASGIGTQITQSGTASTQTINAVGTINDGALYLMDSAGGGLTINVAQYVSNTGTARGDFYLSSGILDEGGTLTLTSNNSGATGLNGNRFSNAGYILIGSGLAASYALVTARMDSVAGEFELTSTTANAATLEIGTNMPGTQIVAFGGGLSGGSETVRIDSNTILPSYANIVANGTTTSVSVLQSQFERFAEFAPGDTIDLVGVSAGSYSYGADPTWGNNQLTLYSGAGGTGTVVARLRFISSSVFATGSSSNFVLSSDGRAGALAGTNITVGAAPVSNGSALVGGTPASFIGPVVSGTLDWSNAASWAGGSGEGGLPGLYQAAEIANSLAQLSAFAQYTLTVNSPEQAGGLLLGDHFVSLVLHAPLTLSPPPGPASGGGFTMTAGTLDIASGGTLSATNYYQLNGDAAIEAGGSLSVAGVVPFALGIGLQGLQVERDLEIKGGTITSGGNFALGGQATVSVNTSPGSSVTATYTNVGQSAVTDPSQPNGLSWGSLSITGAGTLWRDIGGDSSTPFSGAMLVGGGAASVSALGTAAGFSTVSISSGQGSLNVDDSATLQDSGYAILGLNVGSTGLANVQNGAHWTIGNTAGTTTLPSSVIVGASTIYVTTPAELAVGLTGSGSLNIASGGTVTLGGEPTTANGQYGLGIGIGGANVPGSVRPNGTLTINAGLLDSSLNSVVVGSQGDGSLTISNGGTLLAGTSGGIGFSTVVGNRAYALNGSTISSTGTVTIGGGAGTSLMSTNGDFVDGRFGIGHVTIQAGGSLAVAGNLWEGGFGSSGQTAGDQFTVNGGTARFSAGGTLYTGGALTLNSGALQFGSGPANAGTIGIAAGSTVTVAQGAGPVFTLTDSASGGALANNGTLAVIGGTLAETGNIVGGGVLQIGAGATLALGGTVASSQTVSFLGATGALNIGSSAIAGAPLVMAGTITGFQIGDLINVGVPLTAVHYTAGVSGGPGTLTLNAGTVVVGSLTLAGTFTGETFTLASSSTSATIALITTPVTPASPAITSISPDSGAVGDFVTNAHYLTFSGTAPANDLVSLIRAGTGVFATATANASGNWSVTVPGPLPNGVIPIAAIAADAVGNTSLPSVTTITIDDHVPLAPAIVAVSSGAGPVVNGITSNGSLTFSGVAEPGDTVNLFRSGGGLVGTTTAGAAGQWSLALAAALADGGTTFFATATDQAGTTSASSAGYNVTIDSHTPPAPTITGISPDTGVSAIDGVTATNQITVSGTGEANDSVALSLNGAVLQTVITNASGDWAANLGPMSLGDGAYGLTAVSTDSAGMHSAVSATYGLVIDTSATTLATPLATPGGDFYIGNAAALLAAGRPIAAPAGLFNTLVIQGDGTITDAGFAGISHVTGLTLNGTGTESVTLGANASAMTGGFIAMSVPNAANYTINDNGAGAPPLYLLGGSGNASVTGSNAGDYLVFNGGTLHVTEGAGDDYINIAANQLNLAGTSINGGGGYNRLVMAGSNTITDNGFIGVSHIQELDFSGSGAQSLILASAAGAAFGSQLSIYTATATSLTIDASAMPGVALTVTDVGAGSDTLIAGTGGSYLTGGSGADVFKVGLGGTNYISDFVPGLDRITLQAGAFSTFAAVTSATTQYGSSGFDIAVGNGAHVVVLGVAYTSMHAADFGLSS